MTTVKVNFIMTIYIISNIAGQGTQKPPPQNEEIFLRGKKNKGQVELSNLGPSV
jgi:hypothetical protein